MITVGSALTNDVRYQNPDTTAPSARIFSIVLDSANCFSNTALKEVNIEWSAPIPPPYVNDGLSVDIDYSTSLTTISANWSPFTEPSSGIDHYMFCIGSYPLGDDLYAWTTNNNDTTFTINGFALQYGQTYYSSVFAINCLGFISDTITSDGVLVVNPPPVAEFYTYNTAVCTGDTVSFINTSADALMYLWSFQGGTPSTSTAINPKIVYNSSGVFNVILYAFGINGVTDTIIRTAYINVTTKTLAAFSVSDTLLHLPNSTVVFLNSSTGANSYLWDFGDGSTSVDQNPWHTYNTTGVYTVSLNAFGGSCGTDTIATKILYVDSSLNVVQYNEFKDVIVYPNPSSGNNITISFNVNVKDQIEISLFDKTGKQIMFLPKELFLKGAYKKEINIKKLKLSPGSYLLRLAGLNNNFFTEIVVL